MEPAGSDVVTNGTPSAEEPKKSSSSNDNVVATIHKMTEEDVEIILGWAKTEHWNPGCGDAKPFLASDPEGCFISKTEDGEPVATVMGIRYGDDFGFIGLYVCAPQYRGQGHGLAVFNHAMRHLEGRVVGLEGVDVQQDNYRKQGFEVAYQTTRYAGLVKVDAPPFSTLSADEGEKTAAVVVVEKLGEDNVELVLDYDVSHFPAPRTQFMRTWFANPGHTTLVATENGSVTGYGVLRPSAEGARIGPLFANSAKVADLLMRGLAESTSPTTVSIAIDIPEPNDDAVRLAVHLGLSKQFSFARMYTGPAPKLPLERIYAVSLVELG